jgi:hypothetical protein
MRDRPIAVAHLSRDNIEKHRHTAVPLAEFEAVFTVFKTMLVLTALGHSDSVLSVIFPVLIKRTSVSVFFYNKALKFYNDI